MTICLSVSTHASALPAPSSDSLRELDWASRYFRTRQQKLDNTTRALESKLGRKPESDEVADSLGMDLNTFYEFAQAVQNIQIVELEPQDDSKHWEVWESVADDPERDFRRRR